MYDILKALAHELGVVGNKGRNLQLKRNKCTKKRSFLTSGMRRRNDLVNVLFYGHVISSRQRNLLANAEKLLGYCKFLGR